MRQLRKNDVWLYYANLANTTKEYATDANGNTLTVEVDGTTVPVETGNLKRHFATPVHFLGHITPTGIETYAHGNESFALPTGIDITAYDGFLATMKDDIPVTEESLIWETSIPTYDNGEVNEHSADWIISRVAKTLNYAVYLLKAMPK